MIQFMPWAYINGCSQLLVKYPPSCTGNVSSLASSICNICKDNWIFLLKWHSGYLKWCITATNETEFDLPFLPLYIHRGSKHERGPLLFCGSSTTHHSWLYEGRCCQDQKSNWREGNLRAFSPMSARSKLLWAYLWE